MLQHARFFRVGYMGRPGADLHLSCIERQDIGVLSGSDTSLWKRGDREFADADVSLKRAGWKEGLGEVPHVGGHRGSG